MSNGIDIVDILRSSDGDDFESERVSVYFGGKIILKELNQQNTGDDVYLTNLDVIEQSILNMLNTEKGERLFRLDIGSSLRPIIGRPVGRPTSVLLKQLLIRDIERADPRIQVNRQASRVTAYPDENMYDISIIYEVPGLVQERQEFGAYYKVP